MSRRPLPDFLNVAPARAMDPDLAALGWKPAFARQCDTPPAPGRIARVAAVHRDRLSLLTTTGPATCPPVQDATVGDWLLRDPDTGRATRLLDRTSLFQRRAPGTDRRRQLIAANVDTLFIVSSCNQDFNIARLERYLALAHESGVTPVVVLTKSDLSDDPDAFRDQARAIQSGLLVELLDATCEQDLDTLRGWCGRGETVAPLGSSGVGKSTIANTLTGQPRMQTGTIRSADSKGRHTTSHRQMMRLADGGWLIDTPGMRELQMTGVQDGIDQVFADLADLATGCRFRDCQHDTEPGCAITGAVTAGTVDPARLARWRKLLAEDAFNAKSLAQRRAADKAFGKRIRAVPKTHPNRQT